MLLGYYAETEIYQLRFQIVKINEIFYTLEGAQVQRAKQCSFGIASVRALATVSLLCSRLGCNLTDDVTCRRN